MSTRSRIARENSDGSFTSIYAHNDGYPEGPHGVGFNLATHYTDPAKVDALLALGDISSLHERVAPEPHEVHHFRNPAKGVTVAYGRDRGEKDIAASTAEDFTSLVATAQGSGANYLYVFREGKRWLMASLVEDTLDPANWPATMAPL